MRQRVLAFLPIWHWTSTLPLSPCQDWFEPWGDLLPLEPGGSFCLVGTSTEAGGIEVVEEEDRVVVYAWPGSTVQVFQGETLVNDLNVAVPGTPPGMPTRGFVELMFGGPRGGGLA